MKVKTQFYNKIMIFNFCLLKKSFGGGGAQWFRLVPSQRQRRRRRHGGGRGEGGKNAVSPFVDSSRKQILVLLSASVDRFGVSRMRDFFKVFGYDLFTSNHMHFREGLVQHFFFAKYSSFLAYNYILNTLAGYYSLLVFLSSNHAYFKQKCVI